MNMTITTKNGSPEGHGFTPYVHDDSAVTAASCLQCHGRTLQQQHSGKARSSSGMAATRAHGADRVQHGGCLKGARCVEQGAAWLATWAHNLLSRHEVSAI